MVFEYYILFFFFSFFFNTGKERNDTNITLYVNSLTELHMETFTLVHENSFLNQMWM